jgi:SAM-dependent methyltransferase
MSTLRPPRHTPAHETGGDDARYFEFLAAAYVRGRLGRGAPAAGISDEEVVRLGREAGLRMHAFKRSAQLPRVRRVLGILKGIGPASLLDIGSGRGAFLWPLLDAFPWLHVVAIDRDPRRLGVLRAVRAGGISTLMPFCTDAARLAVGQNAADVVTILEVLEHLAQPERAVHEAVRAARRFVVVSVPSRPDNNPEHLHLFTPDSLRALFAAAGVSRLSCDYVHNHWIAVANLSRTYPT